MHPAVLFLMAITSWIIGLALLGAIDSLYTALQQRFDRLFEFCFRRGERVDCKEILHSRYASLFVIPNSWLGIISYVFLAGLYSFTQYYLLGALVATAGLMMSYYLLYVQAFVLRKYCIFCLASTTLMTIITVLAWILV